MTANFPSQSYYQTLFDNAPVAILEIDLSGVKAYLDERSFTDVVEMTQYFSEYPDKLAECVSLTRTLDVNQMAVEIFRAASREQLMEAMTRSVASGPREQMLDTVTMLMKRRTFRHHEVDSFRFDGSPLSLTVTTSVVRGHEGDYSHLLVAMADITHLREAERALSRSEARFRAMAEASPVGTFFYNAAIEIEYVNPAGEAMTGRSEVELMGRGWSDAIHPDDLERITAEVEEDVATGRPFRGSARFLRPDGTVVWWEADTAPVMSPDGIAGFVSVVRDVTQERRLAAELRESQSLLQSVLDNSPSAIWIKDVQGRYLFLNESAGRVAGRPSRDLLGKSLQDILPPDVARGFEEQDHRVIETGKELITQETLDRDGERSVFSIVRFPLRDSEGKVMAVCGISTDVTQRVAAEQARLEERQKIAGEIHDDSVQVMASVALRLEAMERRTRDLEQRARLNELIDSVRDAVDRLRGLMFDLTSPILEDQGLAAALELLLGEIQDLYRVEPHLNVEVGSDIPLPLCNTLFRIAREAISNAARHSGSSIIRVELMENQGGVDLTVEDDGIGMRNHPPESRAGHLGMSSMSSRAEAVGGRFEVSDGPNGKGTRVRAWVPLGDVRTVS